MGKVAEKLKEIKNRDKAEWKDMPEYKFTEAKPARTIKINFRTLEDVKEFEKLLGQKIYETRKTYWYPERPDSMFSNLVYVDEEDES